MAQVPGGGQDARPQSRSSPLYLFVNLLSPAGTEREPFEVEFSITVQAEKVKEKYFEVHGVPARFQELSVKGEVLKENDIISRFCYGGQPAQIQVNISLAAAMTDLQEGNGELKERIIQELVTFGDQGGDDTVTAILGRLIDPDFHVRITAVRALHLVTEKGDERVFQGVLAGLSDQEESVRQACVAEFANVVERGNPRAVATVLARVKIKDKDIRRIALQALSQIAAPGDDRTVTAILARIGDKDARVREAGVLALSWASRMGDDRVIRALTEMLSDKYENVRLAVVEALVKVTEQGDERCLVALTSSLEDADWYVRHTAIMRLPECIADVGDEEAVEAICIRCGHPEADVRRAALEALCEVAEVDDDRALEAIRSCLDDPDELTRRIAEEAMEHLSEPMDPLEKASLEPPWYPSEFVESLLDEPSPRGGFGPPFGVD